MKILVACEESQAVTKELRRLGHEAFSCDILKCSGKNPEWHLQEDVFDVIDEGWEMMIAFPPCTHLASSGAKHFEKKMADGRQKEGIDFFMKLANANIKKIALENPVGIMSTEFRKPDQIIQPYYFGDSFQKTTCLWLKNLPPLFHNNEPDLFNDEITHTGKGEFHEFKDRKTGEIRKMALWYYEALKNARTPEERRTLRSKTFPGIARNMAEQWTK
jgi:hypothetical protein